MTMYDAPYLDEAEHATLDHTGIPGVDDEGGSGLPTVQPGDAGKMVVANDEEDGFDLTQPVTVEDLATAVADEAAARDDAIAAAVADEAAARDDAIAAQVDEVPSPFIFGVPATAPADGDLAANQISFWSNDGSNLLAFKMKNSSGVVKTGTVALT